jgi:hypothetical protein
VLKKAAPAAFANTTPAVSENGGACHAYVAGSFAVAAVVRVEKTSHPMERYESDGEYQRDGDNVNSIVTAPSSELDLGATSSSVILSVAEEGSGIESDVGMLNRDDIFDRSLIKRNILFG